MIEIIGGLWAAGETKTFTINGEYLEILEAQYPCDVMLMDKSGSQLSTMRSSEASFFSRPKEGFQTVQITSAQAQAIRIFIGSGDAGTRRISSTVQVIDGARARSDSGAANGAAFAMASPGAANWGVCQLWNPAGSGRRLVVGQLSVSAGPASGVNVFFSAAPLSTVFGGAISAKKSQVVATVAEARVQAVGALPANPYGALHQLGGGPSTYNYWKPTEPLVLLPGFGICVGPQNSNTGIFCTYEWFEEVI